MLPDQIVPWLVKHGVFDVGPDAEEARREYWAHMDKMGVPRHGASDLHFPLYLWGDDAQFTETQQDKLTAVSFGSSLESGKNSLLFCWPLFVYHHASKQISCYAPVWVEASSRITCKNALQS